MTDYVFGYGSLAAAPGGESVELRGFRRWWGVAMDNRRTIPGYKLYRDPDGGRPAVCVAFLDLRPEPAAAVNGVLLAVDPPALTALDDRERNYARAEVTRALADPPPGRVWAYLGRPEARARLRAARDAAVAVVDANYVRAVEDGFRRLSPAALERFRATTEPHGLPERDLRRIDLPDG